MAKILVTGANGFLASYIIRNLQNNNIQVFGMIRKNANTKNLSGLNYVPLYGQITDSADVERAVKGMDYVIHAAADTSPSHASFKDYYKVNVEASRLLLEASIRYNCKRIIFISSANTIGYGSKSYPGTEQEEISLDFRNSGYAYSKWQAEKLFLDESSKGRIDVIIINPTFMIGLNSAGGSTMKIFDMYFNSWILITTRGGKNFIYVDDAAKAIVNALSFGQNGQKYLLANENLTYLEFYEKLDRCLGRNKLKIAVPDIILKSLGIVGSLLNLFGVKAALNMVNTKILTIKNFYSATKAVQELSMPQTSIDQVLNEMVAYFKKQDSHL